MCGKEEAHPNPIEEGRKNEQGRGNHSWNEQDSKRINRIKGSEQAQFTISVNELSHCEKHEDGYKI